MKTMSNIGNVLNQRSSRKMSSRSARLAQATCGMEPLETRTLMSGGGMPGPIIAPGVPAVNGNVLTGSYGNDVIDVLPGTTTTGAADPSQVVVTVNGATLLDESSLTFGSAGLVIDGNGGHDTINIGNGILPYGTYTVQDTGGAATLTIDQSADSTAHTITQSISSGDGIVSGLLSADVSFNASQVKLATLKLGNGNNVVNTLPSDQNLVVGNGQNTIYGGSGDDTLTGGDGNNVLYAGVGTEDVVLGNGQNTIYGGSGNDTITAGKGNNVIYASSGNQTITVGNGQNTLYGGSGTDTITAGNGNNLAYAGSGTQKITVGNGQNTLYGGGGNDTLSSGTGNDLFVTVGGGPTQLNGGGGINSYWTDSGSSQKITDPNKGEENLLGNIHAISSFQKLVVDYVDGGTATQTPPLGALTAPLLEPDTVLTKGAPANAFTNYGSSPLFASGGPIQDDVEQNQINDCAFMAGLAGFAKTDPNWIEQAIVPLSDGTYAVRFFKSASDPVYYRIDALLPTAICANIPSDGAIWAPLLEKAFAFYRLGQGSYESIQGGGAPTIFGTLAWGSNVVTGDNGTDVLTSIETYLAEGDVVVVASQGNPSDDVIGDHCYTVESVQLNKAGVPVGITLRNPWGVNGPGIKNNPSAYGTLTAAQFYNDFFGPGASTSSAGSV